MQRSRHRLFVGKDNHKFNAAHMTVFPDGTKERLHGHNFAVSVSLELLDVSLAALVDLGDVKRALEAQCRAWNEILLLAERCPFFRVESRAGGELTFTLCGRRYLVPEDEALLLPIDNVVVETLAAEFCKGLVSRLGNLLKPDVVEAVEVELTESPGQGAVYRMTLA
jgi:6-pyruvoyltetrahydropterin/6-carboxytetrahydropterin synthase